MYSREKHEKKNGNELKTHDEYAETNLKAIHEC